MRCRRTRMDPWWTRLEAVARDLLCGLLLRRFLCTSSWIFSGQFLGRGVTPVQMFGPFCQKRGKTYSKMGGQLAAPMTCGHSDVTCRTLTLNPTPQTTLRAPRPWLAGRRQNKMVPARAFSGCRRAENSAQRKLVEGQRDTQEIGPAPHPVILRRGIRPNPNSGFKPRMSPILLPPPPLPRPGCCCGSSCGRCRRSRAWRPYRRASPAGRSLRRTPARLLFPITGGFLWGGEG